MLILLLVADNGFSEFRIFESGFYRHLPDGTLVPEIHCIRTRETFSLPPNCYIFGLRASNRARMLNIFDQMGLNVSNAVLRRLSDNQSMLLFYQLTSHYAPLAAHTGSFRPEAEVVQFIVRTLTRKIQRALFREGIAFGLVVHWPPEEPADAGSNEEVPEANYSDSFQLPDRIPTPDWDGWDSLQLPELTGIAPVEFWQSSLLMASPWWGHMALWIDTLRLLNFLWAMRYFYQKSSRRQN